MQTVATDSTFTAPKKAKTATEPAPTPDQISKVQAEALKLFKVEGGKNEVEYATDEKGGPASYTGSAAKPPAQIKAETKEAEGKLTEEQKKARYEEEVIVEFVKLLSTFQKGKHNE